MSSTLRRITVLVAVFALSACLVPGVAYASLDDALSPVGTTFTNPNPPIGSSTYAEHWWRQGWGNSLKPQVSWYVPSLETSTEGVMLGQLYQVDRDALTVIDSSTPGLYSKSVIEDPDATESGTNFDTTYDLLGIYADGLGSWPATEPGVVNPIEGTWYTHVKYFSNVRYSTRTLTAPLKIDITPPNPVTGLVAASGVGKSQVTTWVPTTRAHITWDDDAYDSLSGVAYFDVVLDEGSAKSSMRGRVFDAPWLPTPNSWTIENMPPGRHKISVICVDRATNESVSRSVYFSSDPDVPSVKFGSFARTVGTRPTFSATTSDAAGIREVVYRLDGNDLGHRTLSPYSISPYLGGYSGGTHTLTATAIDMFGREAVATTTIKLDKTPLYLTSFSRTPSIFYPIRRDGYKDYSVLTFKLSKAASVTLTVRNSKGSTVRTIKKSGTAGTNKMTWNGKWASDGIAHTGTFTYQLTAKDSVGNVVKSVKLTTRIRDYQLVKTGSGTVKVISR